MTTTYSVNGTFIGEYGGRCRCTVNAYKLSRCAGAVLRAQGAAVLVVVLTLVLSHGYCVRECRGYKIALRTSEAYAIVIATGGVNYWLLFNGVNFADG